MLTDKKELLKVADLMSEPVNLVRYLVGKYRKIDKRSDEMQHPEQHLKNMEVVDKKTGDTYTIKDNYPSEMLKKKIEEARAAREFTKPGATVQLPKYITNKPLTSYMVVNNKEK